MKKLCDSCGTPNVSGSIGGAVLCRICSVTVAAEIEKIRETGKPVNALHIARKIYKKEHCGGNYLLRDVPIKLWDRAKHRAVDEGGSLRDLVLAAITQYLEDKSWK